MIFMSSFGLTTSNHFSFSYVDDWSDSRGRENLPFSSFLSCFVSPPTRFPQSRSRYRKASTAAFTDEPVAPTPFSLWLPTIEDARTTAIFTVPEQQSVSARNQQFHPEYGPKYVSGYWAEYESKFWSEYGAEHAGNGPEYRSRYGAEYGSKYR